MKEHCVRIKKKIEKVVYQDQLDRARQIPKKQEVRRCRKQGRLGK